MGQEMVVPARHSKDACPCYGLVAASLSFLVSMASSSCDLSSTEEVLSRMQNSLTHDEVWQNWESFKEAIIRVGECTLSDGELVPVYGQEVGAMHCQWW